MMSVFELYDTQDNATKWLMIDREGGTLCTANWLMRDLQYETRMVLDIFSTDLLEETDENFELYKHCLIEFIKQDSSYTHSTHFVPFVVLPTRLQCFVTPKYYAWIIEHRNGLFETDGNRLIFDLEYK